MHLLKNLSPVPASRRRMWREGAAVRAALRPLVSIRNSASGHVNTACGNTTRGAAFLRENHAAAASRERVLAAKCRNCCAAATIAAQQRDHSAAAIALPTSVVLALPP